MPFQPYHLRTKAMMSDHTPRFMWALLRQATIAASAITMASLGGCGGGGGGDGAPTAGGDALMPSAQAAVLPDQPSSIDVGPYWGQATGQQVSGFDLPADDAVANWTFANGGEFPGATGALSETVGLSGKAAKLTYNFSCGGAHWTPLDGRQCGRYVAMNFSLPSALEFGSSDTPTIAFDVRNLAATASPTLRVIDASGQTLQFKSTARSLENSAGTGWQRVQIPIGVSSSFWGGANDGVLHTPIRGVSILAGDVAMPSPPGDLEVDNVTYLKTSETAFHLKTSAPLSGHDFAASYVGRVGVAWHTRTGYAAVDKAAAIGINVVRIDLQWEGVEVNGNFDFSRYSTTATELAKRNVKVLWILDYGHKDHGGRTPLTAQDRAAYADFAGRAAAFFKGRNVVGYEVWNEPNIEGFWPNPDPIAYANLLGVTVDAIKAADPSAKVITGGVSDADYNFLMAVLRSGKASKVDAIGLHPYRKTAPETFAAQVPTFKKMLQTVGLNAEIWDTEWGYSAYGDIGDVGLYGDGHDARAQRRQAIWNLRKVLTQLAINAPMGILYDLVNDGANPTNREDNFGLLNTDNSDKPAMVALRSLYASQQGRTFKGFLPDVPPGLHVLRWDGASDKSFAIWSEAPSNARVKVTLPANASKVTLWDDSVPPTLNSAKQFYIQERDGPVFVTVPN